MIDSPKDDEVDWSRVIADHRHVVELNDDFDDLIISDQRKWLRANGLIEDRDYGYIHDWDGEKAIMKYGFSDEKIAALFKLQFCKGR